MKAAVPFLLAAVASAQVSDQTASFRISGFLTDAATGEPVSRANAGLDFLFGTTGQAPHTATADAGGRVEFGPVPAGQYRMWAERRGYPRQEQTLAVDKDADVNFRLEPYATLTGTVTDENGDAVTGAEVQVIRSVVQNGRRHLQPAHSTTTDDRGEYRVPALVEGRYYVSADARAQSAGDDSVYPRRFYAGADSLLTASALELRAGARQRVDFRLLPAPAFHLRGQVQTGEAVSGVSVTVSAQQAAERFGAAGFAAHVLAEGRFDIFPVTPGQYLLTASAYQGIALESASQSVAVDKGDVDGIVLTPHTPATITGQVIFETTEPAPHPSGKISLTLEPEDTIGHAMLTARPEEDGTFRTPGAAPGTYFPHVQVPEPYYVKSVPDRIAVGDAGAQSLAIVIASGGGLVNGTAIRREKPAPYSFILLAPRGASPVFESRFAQADAAGKFTIRALAPGEYAAYAFADVADLEYRDPQVLGRYTSAAIHVLAQGKETVELIVDER